MKEEVAKPPKLQTANLTLKSQIEKVIYQYDVRVAVSKFRKKWQIVISEDGHLESTKIDPERSDEIFSDIDKILLLCKPPASPNYRQLIFDFAVQNIIYPLPQIVLPSTDDFEADLEKSWQIMKRGNLHMAPLKLEVESMEPLKLKMDMYAGLTHEQWDGLLKTLKELSKKLPSKLSGQALSIQFMSAVADLRRDGVRYEDMPRRLRQMGMASQNSNSLKKVAKRARELYL